MPSLPPATPDTGSTSSPSPTGGPQPYPSPEGSYCPENGAFNSNGSYNSYDNSSFNPNLATHDRNHNSPGFQPRIPGQCGRPGCQNPVTKASDGTESTYCSSECVMGQCREAYQCYASNSPIPSQQALPAQVKWISNQYYTKHAESDLMLPTDERTVSKSDRIVNIWPSAVDLHTQTVNWI